MTQQGLEECYEAGELIRDFFNEEEIENPNFNIGSSFRPRTIVCAHVFMQGFNGQDPVDVRPLSIEMTIDQLHKDLTKEGFFTILPEEDYLFFPYKHSICPKREIHF